MAFVLGSLQQCFHPARYASDSLQLYSIIRLLHGGGVCAKVGDAACQSLVIFTAEDGRLKQDTLYSRCTSLPPWFEDGQPHDGRIEDSTIVWWSYDDEEGSRIQILRFRDFNKMDTIVTVCGTATGYLTMDGSDAVVGSDCLGVFPANPLCVMVIDPITGSIDIPFEGDRAVIYCNRPDKTYPFVIACAPIEVLPLVELWLWNRGEEPHQVLGTDSMSVDPNSFEFCGDSLFFRARVRADSVFLQPERFGIQVR